MYRSIIIFFVCILFSISCKTESKDIAGVLYTSEGLVIEKIAEHTYQHITYMDTQDYGKVGCNGMIVVDGKEAVIFDTPFKKEVTAELIDWVEKNLNCQIIAVIPTHFHVDCLGGLSVFHDKGIPSYANRKTLQLAKENGFTVPQNGFVVSKLFKVGSIKVECMFKGEGHTKDNVIAHVPNDDVIFGGCLIKSLKAGKGNLSDANVETWSSTVSSIKSDFPDIKTVIPGHGKQGDTALLDFTIDMFQK